MTDRAKITTGVILAAGRGSRMAELQTRLPKPAFPILDKPIVYHQLESMARLGIHRAIVVVSDESEVLREELTRQPDAGVAVEYFRQEEALGIAHCVGCLEHLLDGPFMLFLGDIYFHAPNLGEMVDVFVRSEADAVLGAIDERDAAAVSRNFCILTDESGLATQVIEKPKAPPSLLKGVGVYLFSPVIFDAIRRTPRSALRNEYELTDSIQVLIEDGRRVRASQCVEHDMNVTFPGDLLAANLWVLEHERLGRYVADDAVVAGDATVERAVIGSGAMVGKGAIVRESVVFAGAAVPEGARVERAIFTDSGVHGV
jgi:glucose-1-phosphate thymidylyltransferase